jgi:pimeloyl-ACP methyl ester carboxylesterase
MALESPGEIAGVALLSGYYFPTPRLDALALSGSAVPVVGDLMRYTVSPVLGLAAVPAVFKALFSPAPVSGPFKAHFPTGLALRPWQLRAVAADTAYMLPDAARAAPRYADLTLPMLIAAGLGDTIVSFDSQSAQLARTLPHAELLAVDGGHMVHHIAPGEVTAAIERLIARTSQPRRTPSPRSKTGEVVVGA